MSILRTALLCLLLIAQSVMAQESDAYTERVGERVGVFEHEALNYRLDLGGEAYTYIDFTRNAPDASFAALRFSPNAFTVVVVEDLGPGVTAEQYAEVVQSAMEDKLSGEAESVFKGFADIGTRDERGMKVFQKTMRAEVGATPITYVLSTYVDGPRAYQLLTFGSNVPDEAILTEANFVLSGFSVIDGERNQHVVVEATDVKDYRSPTFGYRFRARDRGWFGWADLAVTNEGADFGALAARGYGAVVMPMCWQEVRPGDNAIYRVMMQQFGEDYPSDFIVAEKDIEKDGATGKRFIGREEAEGEMYVYYQWIVANEQCSYTVAAWGPESAKSVTADLEKIWNDFEITGPATAVDGHYADDGERIVNAYQANALGLHYYESRSFRDAFAFFRQANELVPSDEAYVINAVRSLTEIDAYGEAADWIAARMAFFSENLLVQSWDAWLAYQTNDPEKALRIYDVLFDAGHRDNDDFSAYMELLADAGRWDDLDRKFAEYTSGDVDDATLMLQVQLLTRRERYEDALAILAKMAEGRAFNADLAYERMSILDQMGRPAEILPIANELITKGYGSLQSYYYKGNAEFQLRSYREARESFEQALEFSPANANIREFLDAIDHMLGEGDTTTIAQEIEAVAMPRQVRKIFAANDLEAPLDGYGAVFLTRMAGYEFDGSDVRRETQYRKILVLDDNGITRFSTLEFDFDPSYEQLYVNRLVVRDASGEVITEGDRNTYYITHSESGYEASTEKTVHLPVPSLSPGATIEAVVTKRTSVEGGTFPLETVFLSSDRPVAYSAVFVNGKHDELRYQLSGVKQPRKLGKSLLFELQKPIAFRWEPLQPGIDQILPWVQLGTVSDSWKVAGAEYLAKIEEKLDTTRVAERATRLVEGIESEKRKIEILSAWVQDEIHYEAIEFGRRAYIPKTAQQTLRDRYGDCKDHAVLLYALLEAAGVDASLALVSLNQQVTPGLPNTDQFDHMIVTAQTEGGRVFLDATDKDLRLGQLPPRSMAGNFALELGSEPDLIQIPDYESNLTGISVERVVETRDDHYIDVTETARFTGYQAAELRGQLRTIETSEMQASLQRWIATQYSDAELTEYFVDNIFDAGYDLILEIQYTLPVDTDGSFDVPGFLEAYYLEFDRVADRRFPFEHYFPLQVSAVTSVKALSGRRLNQVVSKPAGEESKFGNWRREINRNNGGLEIRFDYVASEDRFAPEDYREFAEFQRQAVDAIEQRLIIQ